jgi:hypothetical protein
MTGWWRVISGVKNKKSKLALSFKKYLRKYL